MNFIEKIKSAGVVGAGGAGFPTQVKLDATAEYILLNGAECEPLLRVDQQLLQVFADEILIAFEAARIAVGASQGIIGIKEKHSELIGHLSERIRAQRREKNIRIQPLLDVYPAGDEHVLVYELTGRIVPEGGIPLEIGCVVLNAETVLNIFQAMQGYPTIETYLTVAGEVPNPFTSKVPIGMLAQDVIAQSGLSCIDEYAVIDGGPMMGSVIDPCKSYVTKKTKGYIVLHKEHPLIRKKLITEEQAKKINRSSCEQCRMCTDLCPRYLLGHDLQPHKIIRSLNYSLETMLGEGNSSLCCQCNACQLFACPVGIYPRISNIINRKKLIQLGKGFHKQEKQLEVRINRDSRQIPSKRLLERLGLAGIDKQAPLEEILWKPTKVAIAFKQHVGMVPQAIVNSGTKVAKGQLIARIEEGLGANIHASISGIIDEIDDVYIHIKEE